MERRASRDRLLIRIRHIAAAVRAVFPHRGGSGTIYRSNRDLVRLTIAPMSFGSHAIAISRCLCVVKIAPIFDEIRQIVPGVREQQTEIDRPI